MIPRARLRKPERPADMVNGSIRKMSVIEFIG